MAVVQRAARCFTVKEHQTGPYPDPSLHFDTRAEAEKAIADHGMDAHVEQWPEPCWLAKCDDCDTVLGSDDFDEAHYDSQEEAGRYAEAIDDHCADD
jgi:hypothetical protein